MTSPPILELRPYQNTDRDWVIQQNSRHYIEVEGFNADFAIAVVDALDAMEAQQADRRSVFKIAEIGGERVGCVFLRAETEGAGRLHLFLLAAEHRGRGYGRRMLESVLESGRAAGFSRIRVSTFDRHEAACGLYRSFGFHLSSDQPAEVFGRKMRRLDFQLDLPAEA